MGDQFGKHNKGLTSPADKATAITPNDSTDLVDVPRGIYVGGTGNIVATINGVDLTFNNAQAGTILPIRPTRIKATNTTATGLIALE